MRVTPPLQKVLAPALSRRKREKGLRAFTLVELMVVMTVIAIVAAVMVLEMGGSYGDALLRSNARKLIDVCDAASNRAIAAHQAQALKIDVASGKFLVKAKMTGEEDERAKVIEGELDKRVALIIRQAEREEEAEGVQGEAEAVKSDTIVFYADGSADAREFLLKDRAGVELLLRMNPATSRVRVIEMAAE
jgi:type II secretion system protein H